MNPPQTAEPVVRPTRTLLERYAAIREEAIRLGWIRPLTAKAIEPRLRRMADGTPDGITEDLVLLLLDRFAERFAQRHLMLVPKP